MIRPQPNARVYLYAEPVDMRKSINSLAAPIEEQTEHSPFDTVLYVFCNVSVQAGGRLPLLVEIGF